MFDLHKIYAPSQTWSNSVDTISVANFMKSNKNLLKMSDPFHEQQVHLIFELLKDIYNGFIKQKIMN